MDITIYKPTNEEWWPSFELKYSEKKLVQVNLFSDDNIYRISFWGSDDFGLEKDCINEFEAITLFNTLIIMENLTQEFLIKIGFVYA